MKFGTEDQVVLENKTGQRLRKKWMENQIMHDKEEETRLMKTSEEV